VLAKAARIYVGEIDTYSSSGSAFDFNRNFQPLLLQANTLSNFEEGVPIIGEGCCIVLSLSLLFEELDTNSSGSKFTKRLEGKFVVFS